MEISVEEMVNGAVNTELNLFGFWNWLRRGPIVGGFGSLLAFGFQRWWYDCGFRVSLAVV